MDVAFFPALCNGHPENKTRYDAGFLYFSLHEQTTHSTHKHYELYLSYTHPFQRRERQALQPRQRAGRGQPTESR